MAVKTPFRIVIVGGGIGGMATAIALRGEGREIMVLEQSRLHKEIGATISLQPNASRILNKQWKLTDLSNATKGMVDRGFRIYNTEGALVREVPLLSKVEYEGDRVVYHRVDLHNYLKSCATSTTRQGKPVNIRTACRVIACNCEKGTVTLDGGEVIGADLIVGADGIHSVVRQGVLGKEVKAIPTGLSAYRLMMPSRLLEEQAPEFCNRIDPKQSFTSMIMAHDCRLIMGPARNGQLYSIVGLVPDEKMNEDSDGGQSWVSRGSLDKLLESYTDFPEWIKAIFPLSADIGLWQLRDMEPLDSWIRGRTILIGDAAHAMLPTQGQGASQTIEDAEALGTFFEGMHEVPSYEKINRILGKIMESRKARASLVQKYSRLAARPATAKGSNEINMRPDEFMDYNCLYKGAKQWLSTVDTATDKMREGLAIY